MGKQVGPEGPGGQDGPPDGAARPAPRRRPWWLVAGAVLAIAVIVLAVYSGPMGWTAMLLVWVVLYMLRGRGQ